MHLNTPRLARSAVCAAVAVPVLLVAGCSSEPEGGPEAAQSKSPSKSAAPVKFKELPDPCDTVSKDNVKDAVPGVKDESGKNLTSSDTERYGSCLWSGGHGKNDANYRALTVSFKRYDSHASLGSGDKQAKRFFTQESNGATTDDTHKKTKQAQLKGLGEQAVSITYETKKDDHDYRVSRVVVLDHNVVLTVDHEGTGFEGADLPSTEDLRKHAEKVAKQAITSVR